MGRRLFLALLVASVAALAIGAERVEGRVMIVLDASGSMWAPVEGKPKIAIARQAIADMLQGWDPAIEVGLMAYGHRRKGDCADIEVLVPPGPVDAARIARAADAIQPSGMTPLSAAVRRAAEELRWSEERATVILVSDGIETCKADPCEVGAELARMGVAFRAHVIGFDVPQKDEGGLRCLARTTGGLYLAARNAAALNTALRAARQEASAPPSVNVAPSPAKPASPPPPASVNADPAVVAGSQISVRWTGPNEPGDVVGFASPGAGSAGPNAVDVAAGNPALLPCPEKPGRYEIVYVQANPSRTLARIPIEVTVALATLEAVETITIGRTTEVTWTGPNGPSDYITVVAPGAGDSEFGAYAYTSSGSPARIRVPDKSGTYELRYVTGKESRVLARRSVIALAAETSIHAPGSAPAGSPIEIVWTGPDNEGDFVTIVKPAAANSDFTAYFYTHGMSPERGTLPLPGKAGTYEVRYVSGQSNEILARGTVEAAAVTATLEAPDSVKAGTKLAVRHTGPKYAGAYVTIVLEGAPRGSYLDYFYTESAGPTGELDVPAKPGAYELRYVLKDDEILTSRKILVVP